jgi:hypothetical protein
MHPISSEVRYWMNPASAAEFCWIGYQLQQNYVARLDARFSISAFFEASSSSELQCWIEVSAALYCWIGYQY